MYKYFITLFQLFDPFISFMHVFFSSKPLLSYKKLFFSLRNLKLFDLNKKNNITIICEQANSKL